MSAISVVLCLAAVAVSFYFRHRGGGEEVAASVWPAASRIERSQQRPTLIMFAHPMCPCTGASLSRLRAVMSGRSGRVSAHLLFTLPSAETIEGVTTTVDRVEFRLFGATTSGHVVLYDPQGRLLFSGGITGACGDEADNAGLTALLAILRNEQDGLQTAPVFGRSLPD